MPRFVFAVLAAALAGVSAYGTMPMPTPEHWAHPEPTPEHWAHPEPTPEHWALLDGEKVALVIVDTQLCFTNGPREGVDDPFDICNPPATGGSDTCQRYGSLGVATGQSIVPHINTLRHEMGCNWDLIIRSQDYHPENHFSFGSRHFGAPTFAYEGGPVPAVGYPINMHCTVATSGMLEDAHCCLVDAEQDACLATPEPSTRTLDWLAGFGDAAARATTAVAGDTLTFEWSGGHDVYLMPDEAAFDACDFSGATNLGAASPVSYTLGALPAFFACSVGSHCASGQKLKVTAAAPSSFCTVDTDPNNPACDACAADPASCTVMPMNMWTDHCLQSGDSGFATGLDVSDTDIVLQKGVQANIDAYSIFMDNAKLHKTPLDDILKEKGITALVVVGIAYDFCVSWTAQDAADLGYKVYVVSDASAPIALPTGDGSTTVDGAVAAMEGKGVEIITMADAEAAMSCPAGRRHLKAEEQPKGRTYTLW